MFTVLVIIIIPGTDTITIHALLPGDTEYIGIHTLGGVFMWGLVMAGFVGVFIHTVEAIGGGVVIIGATDMAIIEVIIMVIDVAQVPVTEPVIGQVREIHTIMYIKIDRTV